MKLTKKEIIIIVGIILIIFVFYSLSKTKEHAASLSENVIYNIGDIELLGTGQKSINTPPPPPPGPVASPIILTDDEQVNIIKSITADIQRKFQPDSNKLKQPYSSITKDSIPDFSRTLLLKSNDNKAIFYILNSPNGDLDKGTFFVSIKIGNGGFSGTIMYIDVNTTISAKDNKFTIKDITNNIILFEQPFLNKIILFDSAGLKFDQNLVYFDYNQQNPAKYLTNDIFNIIMNKIESNKDIYIYRTMYANAVEASEYNRPYSMSNINLIDNNLKTIAIFYISNLISLILQSIQETNKNTMSQQVASLSQTPPQQQIFSLSQTPPQEQIFSLDDRNIITSKIYQNVNTAINMILGKNIFENMKMNQLQDITDISKASDNNTENIGLFFPGFSAFIYLIHEGNFTLVIVCDVSDTAANINIFKIDMPIRLKTLLNIDDLSYIKNIILVDSGVEITNTKGSYKINFKDIITKLSKITNVSPTTFTYSPNIPSNKNQNFKKDIETFSTNIGKFLGTFILEMKQQPSFLLNRPIQIQSIQPTQIQSIQSIQSIQPTQIRNWKYKGCYNDNNSRAISGNITDFRGTPIEIFNNCIQLALKNNHDLIGIQYARQINKTDIYDAQCFTGLVSNNKYDKYGKYNKYSKDKKYNYGICSYGLGSTWSNAVYVLE